MAAASSSLNMAAVSDVSVDTSMVPIPNSSNSESKLGVGSEEINSLSSIGEGDLKWSLLGGDRLICPKDSIESRALCVLLTGRGILEAISA